MRSWLYQIEEYRKVMATRKLGRGKGALRRNQSSPPAPGQTAAAVPAVVSASARLSTTELSRSSGSPGLVLEARVTEITDVTSFWVQIGNSKLDWSLSLQRYLLQSFIIPTILFLTKECNLPIFCFI